MLCRPWFQIAFEFWWLSSLTVSIASISNVLDENVFSFQPTTKVRHSNTQEFFLKKNGVGMCSCDDVAFASEVAIFHDVNDDVHRIVSPCDDVA